MRKILLSLLLTFMVSFFYAQEGTPQKFKLLGDSFSKELKFEVKPVGNEKITVYIYATNDFKENGTLLKFTDEYTISRGLQTIEIDISNLPAGDYEFDIVQSVKAQRISRNVTRCVYSEPFRKE